MKKKFRVVEAFDFIKRVADFLHWMEEKHPAILEEYESTIKQIEKQKRL